MSLGVNKEELVQWFNFRDLLEDNIVHILESLHPTCAQLIQIESIEMENRDIAKGEVLVEFAILGTFYSRTLSLQAVLSPESWLENLDNSAQEEV